MGKKIYRQGNVLLVEADVDLDRSAARPVQAISSRLILAEGEATGHNHSVSADVAQLFAIDERMVLVVGEPTTLDHQEHAAIEVAPGKYWVIRQREYQRGEVRRVQD